MKSKATFCGSISTVFSIIVLLCVSSIIKRKEKETKKLIKMTLEAIILMIYGYYKTMKMRDNSKTKHVE